MGLCLEAFKCGDTAAPLLALYTEHCTFVQSDEAHRHFQQHGRQCVLSELEQAYPTS